MIPFTIGQTITLIAAAFHFAPDALWFPPLIETLIAVGIVSLALENIIGKFTLRRRAGFWHLVLRWPFGFSYSFARAYAKPCNFSGSQSGGRDSFLQFWPWRHVPAWLVLSR